MDEQALATREATIHDGGKALESVIIHGDLSKLSPIEKVQYYKATCESMGLNPLTQPFAYIKLNGKETLYAKRDATDQLRAIHGVSVTECKTTIIGDCHVVTVAVQDRNGRTDMGTGAVPFKGLTGDALANALMKAETKAKRRATLSICGLGMLDETELETIPARAKGEPRGSLAERARVMLGDAAAGTPEPIPISVIDTGLRTPSGDRLVASASGELALSPAPPDEPSEIPDGPSDKEDEIADDANTARVQHHGTIIGQAPTFAAMTKAIQAAEAECKEPSSKLTHAGIEALRKQYWLRKSAMGWKTRAEIAAQTAGQQAAQQGG